MQDKSNYDMKAFFQYLLKNPLQIEEVFQSKKNSMMSQKSPYETEVQKLEVAEGKSVLHNSVYGTYAIVKHETEAKSKQTLLERTFKLDLAGEELEITSCQKIDWLQNYSDPESVAALHRFIWLQQILTDECYNSKDLKDFNQIAKDRILDWISVFIPDANKIDGQAYHSEVWQTYSVAERVICWLNCLLLTSSEDIDGIIAESIKSQLMYIVNNLEYFGDVHTGNHLSNNGRALFIGGTTLNEPALAHIGLVILQKEAERIISEDGFLREGSAHYQLLITRNYIEVLNYAHAYYKEDAEKIIQPIVDRLLKGCSFFLYKNEQNIIDIPKIGDISPDSTPNNLINSLVLKEPLQHIMNSQDGIVCDGTKVYPDWCRCDYKEWTLFTHVNNICHPYLIGHTHHDTAGIVLMHKSNRLIIDTGRKRYLDPENGGKGKEWYGHSTLSIDGLNPLVVTRGFYTNKFLNKQAGNTPKILQHNGEIKIENHGYERIKGVGVHNRIIHTSEDQIEIVDMVSGKGNHEISILYHIPHSVEKRDLQFIINCESKTNEKYVLSIPSDCVESKLYIDKSDLNVASDEYGREYDISTVECKLKVELPWKGVSCIKIV